MIDGMAIPDAPPDAAAIPGRSNPSRGGAACQLDELSKAIIEKLQQDGRQSYAAIGKAVELSEAAVRQRVQRMVDGGVMQIVAVTVNCAFRPAGSSGSPGRTFGLCRTAAASNRSSTTSSTPVRVVT